MSQKIIDALLNVSSKGANNEILFLIDWFFSKIGKIVENEAHSGGEYLINYNDREEKIYRTMILESMKSAIEIFPDYYQGMIFLSYAFYGVNNNTKSKHYIEKALKILKELDLKDSEWFHIANNINNLLIFHKGEYPNFLNYLDSKSNIIKQESAGKSLKCPKCGNFNPINSIFCLTCGNKIIEELD